MLMNRVYKSYLCKICNKASGVKICKCQKVFYCSRNCQKIDWNSHKTDCCFKLVDYQQIAKTSTIPKCSYPNTTENNSTEPNNVANNNNNEDDIFLQQNNVPDIIHVKHPHTLMQCGKEQNSRTLERGGREYDPTPLQYQQPHATTYTNEQSTTTMTPLPSYSSNTTVVDDFEENLFNSLMYSVVDEGTEQEILKNLNIRAEDLLATYSLDNDISYSLTPQTLKEYVPNSESEEQLLSEKIFDQIQRQQSFENKPETQQLLRETKENLEKELSLFRENHLHEIQETIDSSSIDTMQLSSINQKHVNHAAARDYQFVRTPDEQLALEEMCCNLIRDLNEYGVCVLDNFLGDHKGRNVLDEVNTMYSAGLFKDGQVVATKNKLDHKHIRSDKIMWIDGKEQGLINIKFLINQVDSVITLANRMRNNGKLGQYNIRERTKAMVACYEGNGTHYVKHIDNPNKDGRCITCIYYLNVNWDVQEDGGLLRIFPDGWDDRVADIEPIFDRITFFWSDRRNPHEVQPALRTRYAITLWYFDQFEREQAVRKYQKDCENLRKSIRDSNV